MIQEDKYIHVSIMHDKHDTELINIPLDENTSTPEVTIHSFINSNNSHSITKKGQRNFFTEIDLQSEGLW